MQTSSSSVVAPDVESVTQLVPGANCSLAHVSNEELLRRTRQLVGKSNQVFAALLELCRSLQVLP